MHHHPQHHLDREIHFAKQLLLLLQQSIYRVQVLEFHKMRVTKKLEILYHRILQLLQEFHHLQERTLLHLLHRRENILFLPDSLVGEKLGEYFQNQQMIQEFHYVVHHLQILQEIPKN
jgi:hypothetical protein